VDAMSRTAFLIDGFNLYHSVKDASTKLGLKGTGTRWLNFHKLCRSYLYLVGRTASMAGVYYFSALARHLEVVKPDVTVRHQSYIECLEDTGVIVELGRFKDKHVHCPHCNRDVLRHEEKETDVAISVKLLELFFLDQCDTAILVTGDTDIAPAIRAARRLFPAKVVWVAFPYGRHNNELVKLAHRTFQIGKENYTRHQFPDPYVCADGRSIAKPTLW
jgi:uncharacterized LabA/DUF88 family protein